MCERHLDQWRVAGRAVAADGRGRGRGPGAKWPCRGQVVNSAGVESRDRHHLTVRGRSDGSALIKPPKCQVYGKVSYSEHLLMID